MLFPFLTFHFPSFSSLSFPFLSVNSDMESGVALVSVQSPATNGFTAFCAIVSSPWTFTTWFIVSAAFHMNINVSVKYQFVEYIATEPVMH